MDNFKIKYPNFFLSSIFVLTLLANGYGRIFFERKSVELITGKKEVYVRVINYNDILRNNYDKNIRNLLENYKAQKSFTSQDEVYLLDYKGRSYIANKDILVSSHSWKNFNVVFDSYSPIEIKKVPLGTNFKFLAYALPDSGPVYGTEGINISLEIDSKPLEVNLLFFEQLFIFPSVSRFNVSSIIETNSMSKICSREKIFPYTDIDYLVSRRTKKVKVLKEQSVILNKIIGNYFFDIKNDELRICYSVHPELENEKYTLKANLTSSLRPFNDKF